MRQLLEIFFVHSFTELFCHLATDNKFSEPCTHTDFWRVRLCGESMLIIALLRFVAHHAFIDHEGELEYFFVNYSWTTIMRPWLLI